MRSRGSSAFEGFLMDASPKPTERYQASQTKWDRLAASKPFKDLMATKKIFILPAFVFFLVYYFALPGGPR
jgi:hypothetical protein